MAKQNSIQQQYPTYNQFQHSQLINQKYDSQTVSKKTIC
jgi:hypothetical protein